MIRRFLIASALAVAAGTAAVLALRPREPEDGSAPQVTHDVPVEPEILLAESDRAFLWRTENAGLRLGRRGWSEFGAALKTADRARLTSLFASSFTVEFAPAGRTVSHDGPNCQVTRIERTRTEESRSQAAGSRWTTERFVDWLLSERALFDGSGLHVGFGLKAIAPCERSVPEGDWRGTVEMKLRGFDASGSSVRSRREFRLLFSFVTVEPTDPNLTGGHWLKACEILEETRGHAADALMREVAEERGLSTRLYDNWHEDIKQVQTGGVFLCDFNRDAYTDVLIVDDTRFYSLNLYAGEPGGRFRDVTVAMGLGTVGSAHKAAFADIDSDGWVDLVLPGHSVWRNDQGRRFSNMTGRSNLTALIRNHGPLDNVTGVVIADYDLDGDVDLYVTRGDAQRANSGSWIDGRSTIPWQNQLLQNAGGGQFRDVTGETGTAGGNRSVFTAAWLYADADLRPDLYVIHEFGPGILLLNRPDGPFEAVEISPQSGDFGSMGLDAGDVNNDGRVDLFVSNMYSKAGNRVMDNLPAGFYDEVTMRKLRRMVSGSELYLAGADGTYERVGRPYHVSKIGWGWGARLVDLNNDGWLDLFSTCGFISHQQGEPDG